MKSLETKFNTIKTETTKFSACVSRIRQLDEFGTSEDDIIDKVFKLYHVEYGKDKKHYQFLHCWTLVKDIPNFFEPSRLESLKTFDKRASSTHDVVSTIIPFNSTSPPHILSPNAPSPSASTFPNRPMGTKQGKRLKVDENARASRFLVCGCCNGKVGGT